MYLTTVLKPARLAASAFSASAFTAALVCAASASHAGVARLSIDAFTATSTTAAFVWVADAYQDHSANTQTAGGLGGAGSGAHAASDWLQGPNITATSPFASATGVLTQFTSDLGLTTAGFNLNGTTVFGGKYPTGTLPHFANASSSLLGAFALLDANGNPTAGDITFEVFYSMDVDTANGVPGADYTQTQIDILSDDGDDERFSPVGAGLLSTDHANGVASASGSFSWTFNLRNSDLAYVTLSGSAISSTSVPEPMSLALVLVAFGGLALQRRAAHKLVAPASVS